MIEYRHDLWKAHARARLDSYICGTCRSCVAGSATASTPAVVTGAKAAGSLVVSLSISAGGGVEDANFRAWAIEFPSEYLEAVNAEPAVPLRMEWLKVAADGGKEIL